MLDASQGVPCSQRVCLWYTKPPTVNVSRSQAGLPKQRENQMSMFCYQCQETAGNVGCKIRGVCGKQPETAGLQDLLVYVTKGIAVLAQAKAGDIKAEGRFVFQALFSTITNANFDNARLISLINQGIALRDNLAATLGLAVTDSLGLAARAAATWQPSGTSEAELTAQAEKVGVLATDNEDIRSLRELLVYGLKGIAAYAEHAAVLGFQDETVYRAGFKYLTAFGLHFFLKDGQFQALGGLAEDRVRPEGGERGNADTGHHQQIGKEASKHASG